MARDKKEAIVMLFKNKYWVIVLAFNLITNITNTITGNSGAYYTKWIFGDDNLVGILGAMGLVATLIGFILSKPIIAKLGTTKTILVGTMGAAILGFRLGARIMAECMGENDGDNRDVTDHG